MKTRNIREVKVGDYVIELSSGAPARYKVLEVLPNTFATSGDINMGAWENILKEWHYFKFIENLNWHIEETNLEKHHQNILDGVDDSLEVEFTEDEKRFLIYVLNNGDFNYDLQDFHHIESILKKIDKSI